MNPNQREDLARVLYDFAKISFAALIIGNIAAKERFDVIIFLIGAFVITLAIFTGLKLRSTQRRSKI